MRRTRLAAVMAAFVALALALVACSSGPTDEEVIRQGIDEEFAAVKAGDDELLSAVEQAAGEDFGTLGLDTREFMAAWLEGFDYKLGDIKVDGSDATVHATITCRSMGDIANAFQDKFMEAVGGMEDPTDEDALYKLAGQTLLQCAKDAELKTVECDIACEKDSDGNWSYADGVSDQIADLFLS